MSYSDEEKIRVIDVPKNIEAVIEPFSEEKEEKDVTPPPQDNISAILDECEEIARVSKELDKDVDKIVLCAVSSKDVADTDTVNRILDLLHYFRNHVKTERAKMECEYGFLMMYAKIGFLPKVVEHALNIIRFDYPDYLHKFVACNEIMTALNENGYYEEAFSFAEQAREYIELIDDYDKESMRLVNEANTNFILSFGSNREELLEHRRVLNSMFERLGDDPRYSIIIGSVAIDMLYVDSRLNGLSEKLVQGYLEELKKILEENPDSTAFLHDLGTDIQLLNEMCRSGYEKECVEACKIILDSRRYFTGDFSEVYRLLLISCHKAGKRIPEEESREILNGYVEALENDKKSTKRMMKSLIGEELHIHELTSAYDRLKTTAERDALTGCYNRTGFETRAVTFIKENKGGSLCFFDLDNLKYSNDTFGHDAGDFMINHFVENVKRNTDKEKDVLYRYAGDEFILLSSRKKEELEEILTVMTEESSEKQLFKDQLIPVRFSYGIVAYDEVVIRDPFEHKERLVKLADGRMYECKCRHKKEDPSSVR